MAKNIVIPIALILIVAGAVALSTSLPREQKETIQQVALDEPITVFNVFKSPNCGCCGNYIAYLKENGVEVEIKEVEDMDEIKRQYNVPKNLESCHTALIDKYVVEGHTPIEAIDKLLTEKPNIAGIALAGMPTGSPGMGGTKIAPFRIYQISLDGSDGELF